MGTLLPRLPALLGDFITTYKKYFLPTIPDAQGTLPDFEEGHWELRNCHLHPKTFPWIVYKQQKPYCTGKTNVTNAANSGKLLIPDRRTTWSVDVLATTSWPGHQCELEVQRHRNQVWVGCIWYLRAFFIWGCVFWSSMHNGTSIKFGWNVLGIQE